MIETQDTYVYGTRDELRGLGFDPEADERNTAVVQTALGRRRVREDVNGALHDLGPADKADGNVLQRAVGRLVDIDEARGCRERCTKKGVHAGPCEVRPLQSRHPGSKPGTRIAPRRAANRRARQARRKQRA